MSTVKGNSGGEVLGADPAVLSNDVADYSSVPPASETVSETPINFKLSSVQQIPPSEKEWDYGQKGGADFNMEAPILQEDVVRAGGLGARDEIDSFLPAAVDATDYEESLNDAMQYEDVKPEKEGEISRPGIGFVKAQQQKEDGFREVSNE